MKAERQQKERTSRVILWSKGGGGIVDNRSLFINHANIINTAQNGGNRDILQRQIHLIAGNNADGPLPLDRNSHAYYCLANNIGTILESHSYGSCVGLAIFRTAPNRGMIVHFWSSTGDVEARIANFAQDVNDILAVWGVMAGDQFTIWNGSAPDHILSIERMNAFPRLLPVVPFVQAHATGDAYLNLGTGIVTG